MGKVDMKIIGCLLVIGILLSYAPVFHMDECPGENHSGNIKTDCGGPFHCPMILNIVVSRISSLPLHSLFAPVGMLPFVDGPINSIFRPPEYLSPNSVPRGQRGKNNNLWTLAQELLVFAQRNLLSFDNDRFFELQYPLRLV